MLNLKSEASGRDVITASGRLVDFSTHQIGGHTYQHNLTVTVIFVPARDRFNGVERDATCVLLVRSRRERLVEKQLRRGDVHFLLATNVSIRRERGVGRGRHRVLPLGSLPGHDRLEGEGVDM